MLAIYFISFLDSLFDYVDDSQKLRLRGQMKYLEDSDTIMFIATPW